MATTTLAFATAVPAAAEDADDGVEPRFPASATIADIVVETEGPVPRDSTLRLWDVEPGAEITREIFEDRLALVRTLPFVERATWRLEPSEDGDRLVVVLTPRAIVREVEISGLGQVWRPIFEVTAINVLRLRGGDGLDEQVLAEDVARLEALFRSVGFFAVSCEPEVTHDAATVAILHRCDRGPSYAVGEIEVRGETAIPAEEVADGLRPWPLPLPYYRKKTIDENLEEILEDYRDLGYVAARVRVDAPVVRDAEEEVDLVLTVNQGKRLVVTYEGNEALDACDLDEVLPFRAERSYGSFMVADGAEAIRLAYERAGFPDTVVTAERDSADDEVRVRYTIAEGPQLEIERVAVEGNAAFGDDRIAEVVAGDSNRWLVLPPRWDGAKLDADRQAIRSLYRAHGYADVEVGEPRRGDGDAGLVATFPITEGARFEIGEVRSRGVPDAVAAEVDAIVAEAAGSGAYRAGDVTTWNQRIAGALHDAGFLNAVVAAEETRDGTSVDVTFDATPGPRFVTGPVFLVGNTLTGDAVIESASEIEEGAVLLPEDLGDTQKQIRSLGVFESIRIEPLGVNAAAGARGTGEYRAPISMVFRERPRMEVGAGVRYDTDRGAGASLSWQHNNLFGRALRLSVEGVFGERDRLARVELADPRLFGTSFRASTFTSYSFSDLEAFDEEEFLAGGLLGRDLTDEWSVAFDVTYRITDITNVVADTDDPDAPEEGLTRSLLWTPAVTYDSRDNPLSPTNGMYAALASGLSTTTLASDDDYVRFTATQRNFWPLLDDRWVLALGGSFTHVLLYGDTDVVPASELLFAGGGSSVRGFEEDRVGPLDENGNPLGGSTRVVLNAELRFPVYLPFEGAVFLDAGSVTREISDLDLDSFQASTGVGLRLRSPVGPVRIDYGYQLQDNPPLDRWRIHFSFGYPF